jgi:hypothetical protein
MRSTLWQVNNDTTPCYDVHIELQPNLNCGNESTWGHGWALPKKEKIIKSKIQGII